MRVVIAKGHGKIALRLTQLLSARGDTVVAMRAKAQADAALQASDRDWTIVRPGRLTDDPGSGEVRVDLEPFHGEVSRDDVAAVLETLLHDVPASRQILYLGGEKTINRALLAAAHPQPTGT